MFGFGSHRDFLWEPRVFLDQLEDERATIRKFNPVDFHFKRDGIATTLTRMRDRLSQDDIDKAVGHLCERIAEIRKLHWDLYERGSTDAEREYRIFNAAWQDAHSLRAWFKQYDDHLTAAIVACRTGKTHEAVKDALAQASLALETFARTVETLKSRIDEKSVLKKMEKDYSLPVKLDPRLDSA